VVKEVKHLLWLNNLDNSVLQ